MKAAYLNMATLFTSIPHSNANEPAWAPESSKLRGSKGTRIVFSCTWKENRKNDIDEVKSAHGRIGSVHVFCTVLSDVRLLFSAAAADEIGRAHV